MCQKYSELIMSAGEAAHNGGEHLLTNRMYNFDYASPTFFKKKRGNIVIMKNVRSIFWTKRPTDSGYQRSG
jgi:hypothetical protein